MAGYGIIGGDDDKLEDDGEERSRTIPSRTYVGSIAAFGEKHGWSLMPFLGVRYWGYRNQSNALTELMIADSPHIDYDKKKRLKKEDVSEWEKEMETLKDATPQKINLNQFIIDGKLRES